MNAAVAQLQSALQLVTALAQSAGASGALDADINSAATCPGAESAQRSRITDDGAGWYCSHHA